MMLMKFMLGCYRGRLLLYVYVYEAKMVSRWQLTRAGTDRAEARRKKKLRIGMILLLGIK